MSSVDTITKMIHRYCELFDSADFDAFAKQFEHGSMNGREIGSASLRQWIDDHIVLYEGSPRTKHLTTNVVVDVDEDAGMATARCYVTLVQAIPGQPLAIIGSADYHDRFERVDGAWRWAERTIHNQLIGDSSGHVRESA
jgi:3-phenylpropionate/cinnamic acid dioxygenase small subunit